MVVVGWPSAGSWVCVFVGEEVMELDAAAELVAPLDELDGPPSPLDAGDADCVHPETHPSPQYAGVFPHQPYCEQQVPW